MCVGKILPLMQFPARLFFLVCTAVPPSCLFQYSTHEHQKKGWGLKRYSTSWHTINILHTDSSSPLHTTTPSTLHLAYPHSHSTLPLHLCTTVYLPLPSPFFLSFPPPTLLSSSSVWLFFVTTFSTTFSSSSSWEVAQNPFKCCKSKSIYHNHLSLTVRISYAIVKDAHTHTQTQTAERKKTQLLSCVLTTYYKDKCMCSERKGS